MAAEPASSSTNVPQPQPDETGPKEDLFGDDDDGAEEEPEEMVQGDTSKDEPPSVIPQPVVASTSAYKPTPTHPSPTPLKHTYLSLLPHPQLIHILLSIDMDRTTEIFPPDIEGAIAHLQSAYHHPHPFPHPFPQPLPHPHPHPHPQPYLHHQGTTHYYPSGPPLFTTGPKLPHQQDRTILPPRRIRPGVGDGGLPSYEEMIARALVEIGDPEGVFPKDLFAWMEQQYPLSSNFRPSASQALQKAFKRGRLEKVSGRYRLNVGWGGGTTSRRTTRRPQREHDHGAWPRESAPPGASPPADSTTTNNPLLPQAATTLLQAMQIPLTALGVPNAGSPAQEEEDDDMEDSMSQAVAAPISPPGESLQASLNSLALQLAASAAKKGKKKKRGKGEPEVAVPSANEEG